MKKIYQDYENLATFFNFMFIGQLPRNTRSKTTWACRHGHTWDASYSNIKAGRGCPKCFGKQASTNRAVPPEKYFEIAAELGWVWAGPYPANARIKTGWRCENGHEFVASYRHIKHNKTGCQICADKKTTYDVYYEYGDNDVDYSEIALYIIDWVEPGKYSEKLSDSDIMALSGVNAGDLEVLREYVHKNKKTAVDKVIKNVADFVRVKHIFHSV